MSTAEQLSATTFTRPSDTEVAMTRVFNAPAARVFDAWTRAEHVPHWLMGPDGWTMTVCDIDLRPGGAWRFHWKHDNGTEMGMSGVYREIVPGQRLVSTEAWGGDWAETLNVIDLHEEDGRTTLNLRVVYPTKEARDRAFQPGMERGVSASYDRLERHLAR